jgi:ABC-type branched-subunit amino acid transport system substrate-binding protein
MRRLVVSMLAVMLAVMLVAGACAARGADKAAEGDGASATPTTTKSASGSGRFGTMKSPCGPDVERKKITLDPAEAGNGTVKLYIGVANDRTSEARPGVLKEMYDSTLAFARWCNDQGGIGGLQLETVDLDAKLFNVEAAMTTACTSVFALLGGSFVEDNQMFSGKDGSDFHKCKLIAFPGFALSTDFADANGVIQPVPNHGYVKGITGFEALKKLAPQDIKKTTVVYGDGVDTLRVQRDQQKEQMKAAGGFGFVDDITYQVLNQDWSIIAQKIVDSGATFAYYIGEPENWSLLLSDLKTKHWNGTVMAEVNEYDPKLFVKGPNVADGALVRMVIHPFEEADSWPATKQYLAIMKKDGPPGAKIAALGVQSFSAGLLFATAVNDCAKSTGGKVTRVCVVDAGKRITSWDGGGLHARIDLSGKSTEDCSMVIEADNGTFSRVYPKLGSKDASPDGFHCDPKGLVKIEGDFGKGNVDPSLPY